MQGVSEALSAVPTLPLQDLARISLEKCVAGFSVIQLKAHRLDHA